MESVNKQSIIIASAIFLSLGALYFIGTSYFSMKSQLIADTYIIHKQDQEELVTKLVEELQEIKKIINTMLQHQVQAINRDILQTRNNNQRPTSQQQQSSCGHSAQPEQSVRGAHEKVTEISTKDALQSLLDSNNKPSVLFFHMNGCGWCKKMDPVFDEVSNNPAYSKIKFYRIEGRSSQAAELVQKAFDQKINGFPTLLFVNDGKFIDKQVGFAKKEDFESNIKKYLQN